MDSPTPRDADDEEDVHHELIDASHFGDVDAVRAEIEKRPDVINSLVTCKVWSGGSVDVLV